jgi:hypothetical protein
MAEQDMSSARGAAAGGGPDGPPDAAIVKYLRQSRPWAFVMAGLFAVGTAGLFAMGGMVMVGGLAGAAAAGDDGAPVGAMMAAVGGIYLLLGAFYFVPAWFIGRFAFAADVKDLQGAAVAIRHQRNVWRMFGGVLVGMLVLNCVMIGMIVSVGTALSTLLPQELLEQRP